MELSDQGAFQPNCHSPVSVNNYCHMMPDGSRIPISIPSMPALCILCSMTSADEFFHCLPEIYPRFAAYITVFDETPGVGQLSSNHPEVFKVHCKTCLFTKVRAASTAANKPFIDQLLSQLVNAGYYHAKTLDGCSCLMLYPLANPDYSNKKIFGVNVGGVCVPVPTNMEDTEESDIHPSKKAKSCNKMKEDMDESSKDDGTLLN